MKKKILFQQIIERAITSLSSKGRWLFVAFLGILLIGVIGGLITISNMFTAQVPDYGGTYREGIIGSPRFINPVLAFSDPDHDLTNLVYSGLVRLDPSGNFVADLAASWEISPDGKMYTFTLKDNLQFHDQKPLTADDVVFTVESIQNPLVKSPLKVTWTGIKVSAPDAKTVVFELPKPYAGFLNQVSIGIIPSHIWKSFITTEDWQTSIYNTEPVGSGPFRFLSVTRSKTGIPQKYTFLSFNKFAMGKPFINKIVITSFANNADALDGFINKDVDGIASVDPEEVSKIQKSWVAITTQSTPRVFSLFLNGEKNPILKDVNVLRALKIAAPKDQLVKQVFMGYADPLNGPLPIFIDQETDPSNITQASEILDKAGWVKNADTGIRQKGTQVLKFTLATANTSDLHKSAEIIAEVYKQLGVEVELQFFELGTLQENVIRKRDFETLLFGQIIKHDTDLFAFWHSSQRTDPGLNIVNYTNAHADHLLETAITETDRDARFELYAGLTKELETGPVIFLYAPRTVLLTHDRVKGISLPPISQGSNRFTFIHTWYINTNRIWNWFAH